MTHRPAEADAIRRGVALLLAGGNLTGVARDWNGAGLVTPLKGRRWRRGAVRDIIRKPRNAGLRIHRREVIGRAQWEPIVPEEQWRAVVAIFDDEDRRTHSVNPHIVRHLGSGLFVCGGCGEPDLRVSTSGSLRKSVPHYRCARVGRPDAGPHVARGMAALDAYVSDVVVERLSRPDVVELLRPAAPSVDLDGLRATVNAVRAGFTEIAQMFGAGEMSKAEWLEARESAQQRLSVAETALAAATATSPLHGVADAPDPAAVWYGLDLSRRRAVLAALMTVVVQPVPRGGGRARPLDGIDLDPTYIRIEPRTL